VKASDVQALKTSRRTNATLLTLALACALQYVCAKTAAAQTTGARRASSRESKQAARARADEARRRAEVQEAVAALSEAADAARSFEDEFYKAVVQADAADALWPFDEQGACAVLRRAWEVTTAPGVEDRMRGDEGDSEDASAHAHEAVLDARRLVIKIAIKHDARLADAFMREFERGLRPDDSPFPETGDAADSAGASASPAPRGALNRDWTPADWQRLYIAHQLLKDGSPESAARAASPLAGKGPTLALIDFLLDLRAADARAADALYLRLIQAIRADPEADANDVLFLSMPIVSPELFAFTSADGSVRFAVRYYRDEASRRAASSFPAELRAAFFGAAAPVLLRARTSGQGGASPLALYFAAGRLLPFFEREAAQYAAALQARVGALASELGASRAQSVGAGMNRLSLTAGNTADPLADELKMLSANAGADARDTVSLQMVLKASRLELWERARGAAAGIEDARLRRDATRAIAVYQVMGVARAYDEEPDGHERAADFVRAADVPNAFRAAGLARAAELASRRGKKERAESLFGEALLFAEQAEKDDGSRLAALVFVSKSLSRAGSARVWEILPALVAAWDESEDYWPDGPQFSLNYGERRDVPAFYNPDEPLKFEDAFAAAARMDFRRAMREVRTLEDEPTRASVTIAAARAALEKNGKAAGEKAR
jgi:hypothetical protein